MPRPTEWLDTIIDKAVVEGGQGLATLITGLAPSDMRGTTVIRTLVSLGIASSTVAGAWGVGRVDMAIGIASQEAFAAGVIPDPVTSTDRPARGWMWRTSRMVAQNGAEAGGVVTQVLADIRGARKVENGEVYIVIDHNTLMGTAFPIRVLGLVRLLVKLS